MDMNPRFHPAQTILASGDVDGLRGLLEADPELASARSDQSHPTLLRGAWCSLHAAGRYGGASIGSTSWPSMAQS